MLSRRVFVASAALGCSLPAVVRGVAPPRTGDWDSWLASLQPDNPLPRAEHWTLASDDTWQWFERQTWVDGRWKVTGITTPIEIATGERYTGHTGYLDDELVPETVRFGSQASMNLAESDPTLDQSPWQPGAGKASPERRAQHGRPASPWLRQLDADELRGWLATVEVPEAGVSGMTYREHLTRDHGFAGLLIAGLTESEQAKLHAAAHYGY
jgi:hypothetical protein